MNLKISIAKILESLITTFINSYYKLIYLRYRSTYEIDESFKFNGINILFYGSGQIICGQNSYISDYSTLYAAPGNALTIGNGCQISSNVRIFTESLIPNSDFSYKPVPSRFGNVKVGNYCWIGANVLINPGLEIGENSVVGANSVVTKNIPAGEIWGGVPARFIKKKTSL